MIRYAIDPSFETEFVVDCFGHSQRTMAKVFYSERPMAGAYGSRGELQPWGMPGLHWIFPPKMLYNKVAMKIKAHSSLRAVFVSLLCRQNEVLNILVEEGHHLPDYCAGVWSIAAKISQPESTLRSYFTGSWHTFLVIFISKGKVNHNLRSRCLRQVGSCSQCGGNPMIRPDRRWAYPKKTR